MVIVLCQESSWFVKKIVIKESIHSLFEFQFPCHSWLECSTESPLACKRISCRRKFITRTILFSLELIVKLVMITSETRN